MKKVCIIGLGYIGLPTALIAAEAGYDVLGFDISKERVNAVNDGTLQMCEPGVQEKLSTLSGMLRASLVIEPADFFVVAVPTPFLINKSADLSHVFDAAHAIISVIKVGDTIILESTVPVGTTHKLARMVEAATGLVAGVDFFCAYCPERVLPGKIFHELIHNPRVIGGINHDSAERAQLFYKEFVKGALYLTTSATAEMVKLIENSYRDVQVAFAHQVAAMAEVQQIDPYEVIELANKHPRIQILKPTCGVGGHCIAIDPWFLIETFPQQTQLLLAAREVNDARPMHVIDRIKKYVYIWTAKQAYFKQIEASTLVTSKCRVLILGATYKPDVDDLRESPALAIAQQLAQNEMIESRVYEPHVGDSLLQRAGVVPEHSLIDGIAWADVIVCLVAHTAFKHDRILLESHEHLLDFCGITYKGLQEPALISQDFWPAHKTAFTDSYVS